MSTTIHESHTDTQTVRENGVGEGGVAQRWPVLRRGIGLIGGGGGQYERKDMEIFSSKAYDAVEAGIIRLEERNRLAKEAQEMGIRAFDAQLLIACAVRQWVLDHRYDTTPSKEAPALSFEYRAWRMSWARLWALAGITVVIEGIILWRWLG
ncbi:MAG: hypothetical protein FWD61_10825 [Phycisphaerales bacterium]|nr:hypothetical protein [Phycisphaerales bacterium]